MMDSPIAAGRERPDRSENSIRPWPGLRTRLTRSFAAVLAIVVLFETLQHRFLANSGDLRAAITDICFFIVASTIGIYLALSKQDALMDKLSGETSRRKKLDDALTVVSKALEQSADLVMITDKRGVITYVNPEFEKSTGYTAQESIGNNPRLLKSGKQNPPFYEALWQTILSGQVYRGELINQRKSGELYYQEETITPIRDSDGEITHFVSTARDITERKRMEDFLAKRQQAFESVYQLATRTVVSLQDICEHIAIALARLLRCSHVVVQQFVGSGGRVISVVEDGKICHSRESVGAEFFNAPAAQAAAQAAQAAAQRHSVQASYLARHDIKLCSTVPIKDTAGKLMAAVTVMDRDERTITSDEIQLVEIFGRYIAIEMERESMKAQIAHTSQMQLLGQVASGIAHEVRNPLTAILSITQVVCRDLKDSPEYAQHLTHIRTQATRLSVLIEELLDLGKPLSAEGLQRISLGSVCVGAIDLWRQYTSYRNREIRLISSVGSEGDIVAHSGKLQQVFLNLLENAAQHSPDGSEIQMIVRPGPNTVSVQVIDLGSGISDENVGRVFEPFFTTRPSGTGLGLTVVKQIVDLHRAAIAIENNDPGPGCTVTINFPAAGQ